MWVTRFMVCTVCHPEEFVGNEGESCAAFQVCFSSEADGFYVLHEVGVVSDQFVAVHTASSCVDVSVVVVISVYPIGLVKVGVVSDNAHAFNEVGGVVHLQHVGERVGAYFVRDAQGASVYASVGAVFVTVRFVLAPRLCVKPRREDMRGWCVSHRIL